MKRFLLCATALALSAGAAEANTKYTVYCASDRIEVDSRDDKQMKIARGSGICSFGSFNYRMDAEKHSKQFGGVGGKCSCR
jgi:hypothetical protein